MTKSKIVFGDEIFLTKSVLRFVSDFQFLSTTFVEYRSRRGAIQTARFARLHHPLALGPAVKIFPFNELSVTTPFAMDYLVPRLNKANF